MNYVLVTFLLAAFAASESLADTKLQCKLPKVNIPQDWITMVDPCVQKMKDQVQQELTASMTYLAMGAHFSRDTVNRPGFAKYFFESAKEEREHAIKFLEYLLMRGGLTEDLSSLIKSPEPNADTWPDAITALRDALKLEAHVTRKIRDIIKVCEEPPTKEGEPFNDYHLVDYLSGDFLTEQYEGQRDLAGKISTLGKMMAQNGQLGEFMFDKNLLE
nr:PREDICTED: ferritin subunit [Bemisia tabaci]